MRIPRLRGVVLGGGYGRGEGGVFVEEGTGRKRLSNDLDFHVVAEEGIGAGGLRRIDGMLKPLAETWTGRLGIDVDFCPAKTPRRFLRDQERLMVQELIRGYVDVAGEKGEVLFGHLKRLDASALPWTEAVRLLVNRGAGLLLAGEEGRDRMFVARNLNKCVLGAGDARLIAEGAYRWRAEDRERLLGDELYSKALAWKFRPTLDAVCDREKAREVWLAAAKETGTKGVGRVSAYQAFRWIGRRGTLGKWRTLGLDPVVRIFDEMADILREGQSFPASLKKDWRIFN